MNPPRLQDQAFPPLSCCLPWSVKLAPMGDFAPTSRASQVVLHLVCFPAARVGVGGGERNLLLGLAEILASRPTAPGPGRPSKSPALPFPQGPSSRRGMVIREAAAPSPRAAAAPAPAPAPAPAAPHRPDPGTPPPGLPLSRSSSAASLSSSSSCEVVGDSPEPPDPRPVLAPQVGPAHESVNDDFPPPWERGATFWVFSSQSSAVGFLLWRTWKGSYVKPG